MLSRPLLAALIAGIVSATGFAPLDWWPLTLVAFAVLLALVHGAPSMGKAMLRGWVFGVGHFTLGNNWIQHAFTFQDKMPHALGYFAVVALALYLAVYPALFAGLAWRFGEAVRADRRGPPGAPYVLVAAAAWIVSEWLRAKLFTGYAWGPLGLVWLPTPVAGSAAWIGTYALSGVAILTSGALLLLALRRWHCGAAVAVLLALLAIPGLKSKDVPSPDAALVRVVQPNIGQDGVDQPGYAERTLTALVALSGRPGPRPRLVVWPEGMVNQYIEDGYPRAWYGHDDPRLIRARIASALGERDHALVGGTALEFDAEGKLAGAGNTVFQLDSAGMLAAKRYDKAHLVPYGEYLPMRTLLQPLGLARLVMGDIDFLPGPGPRTLDVPGIGPVGVQICYEIIFSGETVDPRHRPALLFNPSNDAWFGAWGPPQHLAQARMRAIEEGLPILRATPTGISAVIDADGRLVATIPHGEAGAIETPLPPPHAPTLFSRMGNALAFLVAGLFVLMAIAIRRFAR